MNSQAIIIGIVELILSFLLGLLTVWMAFRWFARLTKELNEIKELQKNNMAVGILLSAVLIATALIVRQSIYPAMSTWQTFAHQGFDATSIAAAIGITLLSLILSLALSLLGIWGAVNVFCRLTSDIDEIAEIGQNNIAVALVLGTLIVVMGLFLSHGVLSLLSSIIPMPAFENIRIMGVQ